MNVVTKSLKFVCALSALCVLPGCLEGWQVVYTKDILPYGNSRTAGSGVMYVRGGLMPAKFLNLKTLNDKLALNGLPVISQPLTTERVFLNRQLK